MCETQGCGHLITAFLDFMEHMQEVKICGRL